MKTKNKYIVACLLSFSIGQVFIEVNSIKTVVDVVKEEKKISSSPIYIVDKNTIWQLKEVIGNESGKITTAKQEVQYVYQKVDMKEWENKKRNLLSKENKLAVIQKQHLFSGNGSQSNQSSVGELIGALSGQLSYGEYTKENRKDKWF